MVIYSGVSGLMPEVTPDLLQHTEKPNQWLRYMYKAHWTMLDLQAKAGTRSEHCLLARVHRMLEDIN